MRTRPTHRIAHRLIFLRVCFPICGASHFRCCPIGVVQQRKKSRVRHPPLIRSAVPPCVSFHQRTPTQLLAFRSMKLVKNEQTYQSIPPCLLFLLALPLPLILSRDGLKRWGETSRRCACARRPLVRGDGRAAGGVSAALHVLALLLLRPVTDTVQGADVAGGLHQVAQGAEHLHRVGSVVTNGVRFVLATCV